MFYGDCSNATNQQEVSMQWEKKPVNSGKQSAEREFQSIAVRGKKLVW